MPKYVSLNPKKRASSFFDPMQKDSVNQSLSNEEQIIIVEETELVQRFLDNKGLIERSSAEYKSYRIKEDARIEQDQKEAFLRRKGGMTVNVQSDPQDKEKIQKLLDSQDELSLAHEELTTKHAEISSLNEELLKKTGDQEAEISLLREQNEKLAQDLNTKSPDVDAKKGDVKK